MPQGQLVPVLTKQDVCAQLKVSPRTIENMVKSGDFPPAVRIGKLVYWSQIALSRWQQKRFADQEAWNNER